MVFELFKLKNQNTLQSNNLHKNTINLSGGNTTCLTKYSY